MRHHAGLFSLLERHMGAFLIQVRWVRLLYGACLIFTWNLLFLPTDNLATSLIQVSSLANAVLAGGTSAVLPGYHRFWSNNVFCAEQFALRLLERGWAAGGTGFRAVPSNRHWV